MLLFSRIWDSSLRCCCGARNSKWLPWHWQWLQITTLSWLFWCLLLDPSPKCTLLSHTLGSGRHQYLDLTSQNQCIIGNCIHALNYLQLTNCLGIRFSPKCTVKSSVFTSSICKNVIFVMFTQQAEDLTVLQSSGWGSFNVHWSWFELHFDHCMERTPE